MILERTGRLANHVDDRQNTRSVSHQASDIFVRVREVNVNDTKRDIGSEVGHKEEQLEASGQRPDVERCAELDLAIVSLPKYWGVQDVAFQAGEIG